MAMFIHSHPCFCFKEISDVDPNCMPRRSAGRTAGAMPWSVMAWPRVSCMVPWRLRNPGRCWMMMLVDNMYTWDFQCMQNSCLHGDFCFLSLRSTIIAPERFLCFWCFHLKRWFLSHLAHQNKVKQTNVADNLWGSKVIPTFMYLSTLLQIQPCHQWPSTGAT